MSDCVLLNLVNAYEISDKQECSYKDLYFTAVVCNFKVPEGSGINAFWLGRFLMLLVWDSVEGIMWRDSVFLVDLGGFNSLKFGSGNLWGQAYCGLLYSSGGVCKR